MASLVLSGDTSGSVTLAAPAVAGSTTQTLVNVTGTLAPIVSGTAVASTSGTSIDFTGIPSWVRRITVMFNGVSTNGSSILLIQLGTSSGIENTGYTSAAWTGNTTTASQTTGLALSGLGSASYFLRGNATICLLDASTRVWSFSSLVQQEGASTMAMGGGNKTLSATLDRVRITTVNGTDTFDAGTINILYE
jgi:hypothetical protein